jgi:hypothetical protein
VGEKLRSGQADTDQALFRAGRFKTVRDNLEVKEIIVGNGEKRVRYVLARNPREAERDRRIREELLHRAKEELRKIGDLKGEPHTRACCALITHPSLGRYIKTNRRGRPRLDADKIKAEEKLDGKYLLSTSDDTTPPKMWLLATSSFMRWKTPSEPSRQRCRFAPSTTGSRIASEPTSSSAGSLFSWSGSQRSAPDRVGTRQGGFWI